MRSRIWLVVRWLVGIGILAAIAANIDFGRLERLWRPALLVYLAGAALILVGAQLVSAARWRLLLRGDGLSWLYLARLYLIGNFFSAFLPTSVGGDAVRTGALVQEGVSLRRSVASVLFDRILGVAGMVPLLVAGGFLVAADPATLLGHVSVDVSARQVVAIAAGAALLGGGAAVRYRRVLRAKFTQFAAEVRDLAGSKANLTTVLALGVAVQVIYVLAWGTLAPAVGLNVGWGLLLFAVPVVSVAAMLPVSVAGLGVREGVWIVLLGGSFAAADVVAFSLLYFVAFSLSGSVGGVLYIFGGVSTGPREGAEGEVSVPETVG